jgi:hypothetical protein
MYNSIGTDERQPVAGFALVASERPNMPQPEVDRSVRERPALMIAHRVSSVDTFGPFTGETHHNQKCASRAF